MNIINAIMAGFIIGFLTGMVLGYTLLLLYLQRMEARDNDDM